MATIENPPLFRKAVGITATQKQVFVLAEDGTIWYLGGSRERSIMGEWKQLPNLPPRYPNKEDNENVS